MPTTEAIHSCIVSHPSDCSCGENSDDALQPAPVSSAPQNPRAVSKNFNHSCCLKSNVVESPEVLCSVQDPVSACSRCGVDENSHGGLQPESASPSVSCTTQNTVSQNFNHSRCLKSNAAESSEVPCSVQNPVSTRSCCIVGENSHDGLQVESASSSVSCTTQDPCTVSQNFNHSCCLKPNVADTQVPCSVQNLVTASSSSSATTFRGAVPKISPRDPPHFCTRETRSSSFDHTSSFVKDSTKDLSDQMSPLAIDSSRKASLPAVVSEPAVVSASSPELWMLSGGPVRTFARCGRNSVPRISYSKSRDTHTVLCSGGEGRPIYPSLPFSPFCSPSSSPRLPRHQPRESRKVIFESRADYEQLNHYRLKGEIGQVSGFILMYCKTLTFSLRRRNLANHFRRQNNIPDKNYQQHTNPFSLKKKRQKVPVSDSWFFIGSTIW